MSGQVIGLHSPQHGEGYLRSISIHCCEKLLANVRSDYTFVAAIIQLTLVMNERLTALQIINLRSRGSAPAGYQILL